MRLISHKIHRTLLRVLTAVPLVISFGINAGSDPYVGEIGWTTASVAPAGWAFCDGQLLNPNDYLPLFSLIGVRYGGNGLTTFGLPDLRGRMAIGTGTGPGLSSRSFPSVGGVENVQLTTAHLPSHNHNVKVTLQEPEMSLLDDAALAGLLPRFSLEDPTTNDALNDNTVSQTGNGAPQNNVMPHLAINCIIALTGQYPSNVEGN
jgi:microcystin-dependent protein